MYGATFGGRFLAISLATGRARVIWQDRQSTPPPLVR